MLNFIVMGFVFWRLVLLISAWAAPFFVPRITTFFGPVPWANFDGVHYLSIAENSYHINQQAFFPLFPFLIHIVSVFSGLNHLWASLAIVHIACFSSLFILWKLVSIDYNSQITKRTMIALLIFPTSFFLGSIYTEGIFLMFVLGSFYASRKGKWWIAGVLGFFAAMTRFVGIFLLPALLWEMWEQNNSKKMTKKFFWLLLIPLGTLSYMFYLHNVVGDALAFIHVQPAFGANRSGGEIIFLPQVMIRYIKIFFTVPFTNYSFWIALLEFTSFAFGLGLLILLWQKMKKMRKSYIIFSLFAILVPTLSGTFSSMPRYVLVSFPIFILLAHIENKFASFSLAFFSIILLIILTMFFVQGHFIA